MAALRVELMDLIIPGAALRCDIDLTADKRLNPLCLTGSVKVNNAVHYPVVGNGAGGLPHGLHNFGQVSNAAGTVQKTVLRMDMQMDKRHITPPENRFSKIPGTASDAWFPEIFYTLYRHPGLLSAAEVPEGANSALLETTDTPVPSKQDPQCQKSPISVQISPAAYGPPPLSAPAVSERNQNCRRFLSRITPARVF